VKLRTELYLAQAARWPQSGEHILAHHDEQSLVVYQAYRPSIGRFAIEHGHFGGPDFSLSRMSWVKPNFLWMMYRSGWGSKEGQEVTLGLRLRRAFFDELLAAAVPSSFDPALFDSREAWQSAVARSDVRLQWDPDHAPSGARLERRAVQLGLRGETLAAFAKEELLEVIALTEFVATQRALAQDDNPELLCPVEHVYRPSRQRENIT
jgi:Domain of unknown function (DUF4291)